MFEHQISKFVFFSCLGIVIISSLSLIFPALLVEITNEIIYKDVNVFEFGKWAIPIIVVNILFIGFYILYNKNKIPYKITNFLDFIINNDISKRTALIIILFLFFIYLIFTVDELTREEFELGDYTGVIQSAKNFEFSEIVSITPQLRYFLLHVSYVVFENVRILPFIASISLLIITYFLTLEITKKRLSAIIAFSVLLQSNLFLIFDTTATYENFWVSFYFFSLYLIYKKPNFSAITFVLSMMSKPLSIIYLPISIFTILNKKSSKITKIILLISYSIIILIIIVAFLTNNLIHTTIIDFNFMKIISSFNEIGNSLRFDTLILVLMIPTLIILASKTGKIRNRINTIFIGISVVIISQPLMYSLIDMTLQPYRFVPLIVFYAIGIGIIFSNSNKLDQE